MFARSLLPAAVVLTSSVVSASADGFDESQAKSRIEAAGYGKVAGVHQGNLGDWMAEAEKDGNHVLVVLHADGNVDVRQRVQVAPVPVEPVPSASTAVKP